MTVKSFKENVLANRNSWSSNSEKGTASFQLERSFENPGPVANTVKKTRRITVVTCPSLCLQLHFAVLKKKKSEIASHSLFMILFKIHNFCDPLWLPNCFPTKPWPFFLLEQATEGNVIPNVQLRPRRRDPTPPFNLLMEGYVKH